MYLLDRYILREMWWPFVGGLLAFVVLISGHMLFQAVEVMVDHRVALYDVVRYVGYQIPGACVMALPVAVLLGASLALNRLTRDHELHAVRFAGISPMRIMVPVCLLGLLAAGLSLWLQMEPAPRAQVRAESLLREIILSQKALAFPPNRFIDTGRGVHFFVEDTDETTSTVYGVHAFFMRPDGLPILYMAPEARFSERTLSGPRPRIYAFDILGNLSVVTADSITINLAEVSTSVGLHASGFQAMTLPELLSAREEAQAWTDGMRPYDMELHSRLAIAFACVLFALVAGPVVMRFGRRQGLVGILATLLVIFVYYVMMLWMRMLGGAGNLPVWLAAWGQNAFLLLITVFAIWRQR